MHQKNIVHLDLKPENILLVSPDSDDLKLIDFGLARVVSPDRDVICKFGTPEFVAPEVICKQPVTTASDVWSIGVIAHILLSGISPFMGDDDKQTLLKVRRGYWDFDDDVWRNISEEAKEFLKMVLVLDPKKRWTLDTCLQHSWLKFDERHDQGVAKLSTLRLKTFNSRRKWQKALTAVKSAMRLRRLSSVAASDLTAFRQRHLQSKQNQDSAASGDNKKSPEEDGQGQNDENQTGEEDVFLACPEEDEGEEIKEEKEDKTRKTACWSGPDGDVFEAAPLTNSTVDGHENLACTSDPPLKRPPSQNIPGPPPEHDTSTMKTSSDEQSVSTPSGMTVSCPDACICNSAREVESNPSTCGECSCLHDPSLVQCCDFIDSEMSNEFVQSLIPSEIDNESNDTVCDLRRSTSASPKHNSVQIENVDMIETTANQGLLEFCDLNENCNLTLSKTNTNPSKTLPCMENIVLLKESLDLVRDNSMMETCQTDSTTVTVIHSPAIAAVSCEFSVSSDQATAMGGGAPMEPMTTLAACYTENVPDLDVGAVPPGEASAELESMKLENLKAEDSMFGYDGAVNGEKESVTEENAFHQAAGGAVRETNGTDQDINKLGENLQKQAAPVFSKRKWSKTKLMLPSALRRIQENRELSVEERSLEQPPKKDLDHNSNLPPSQQQLTSRWSKESMDSVDLEDEVGEASTLMSPDVMAFDSRHCAEKKRQNLPKDAIPKLLSITELMMKLARDSKRKKELEKDGGAQASPSGVVGRSPVVRFPSTSFNTSMEVDVKGHLDFLVCEVDERLNVGSFQKWLYLRYHRIVRFFAGVIFGLLLGAVCRIIF